MLLQLRILPEYYPIFIFFCFRYAPRCSGDIPQHTTWKTSYDVFRYFKQRNSAGLQKIHARCKYLRVYNSINTSTTTTPISCSTNY